MKIVDVRVLGVRVNHRGNWIFVQVETDDGIVGLGEASHSGDDAAVTFLLRRSLRPKLIGRDPSSVEAIWRDLAQRAAGGLIDGRLEATALSGVEQALWGRERPGAGRTDPPPAGGRAPRPRPTLRQYQSARDRSLTRGVRAGSIGSRGGGLHGREAGPVRQRPLVSARPGRGEARPCARA